MKTRATISLRQAGGQAGGRRQDTISGGDAFASPRRRVP